jgi:hypothetical protein
MIFFTIRGQPALSFVLHLGFNWRKRIHAEQTGKNVGLRQPGDCGWIV